MLKRFRNFRAKLSSATNKKVALAGYAQATIGWLRFGFFRPKKSAFTFSSYRPDSFAVFALHPEAALLLQKWIKGNRRNNAGDLGRFHAIILNLKQLIKENIPGDFAELGVYKGNSAAVLAHFAARSGRKAVLFDTFGGFDDRDLVGIDARGDFKKGFSDTSLAGVRQLVGEVDRCVYIQGYFPNSITPEASQRAYAFVHIDCDLYKPMQAALKFFYPLMSPGGIMFLHDYSSGPWAGATKAIDEFCAETGEAIMLLPDKSGTAVLRKRRSAPNTSVTQN